MQAANISVLLGTGGSVPFAQKFLILIAIKAVELAAS
jgi:hypothetical protein